MSAIVEQLIKQNPKIFIVFFILFMIIVIYLIFFSHDSSKKDKDNLL